MNSERRAFRLKFTDLDETAGTFEGYASVFGNVDLDGEVVDPGAFTKTIRESKGVVPILWQHDPYDPIGFSSSLEEDDHGLKVVGELNLEVEHGRAARALMKQASALGAKLGLSIGYRVMKDGVADGARHLHELALREFSPVTFPANTAAGVTAVKSSEDLAELVTELERMATKGRPLGEHERDFVERARAALASLPGGGADTRDLEPARATLGALSDEVTTYRKRDRRV